MRLPWSHVLGTEQSRARDRRPRAVPAEPERPHLGGGPRRMALAPKWGESQGITLMLVNTREPRASGDGSKSEAQGAASTRRSATAAAARAVPDRRGRRTSHGGRLLRASRAEGSAGPA